MLKGSRQLVIFTLVILGAFANAQLVTFYRITETHQAQCMTKGAYGYYEASISCKTPNITVNKEDIVIKSEDKNFVTNFYDVASSLVVFYPFTGHFDKSYFRNKDNNVFEWSNKEIELIATASIREDINLSICPYAIVIRNAELDNALQQKLGISISTKNQEMYKELDDTTISLMNQNSYFLPNKNSKK